MDEKDRLLHKLRIEQATSEKMELEYSKEALEERGLPVTPNTEWNRAWYGGAASAYKIAIGLIENPINV